MPTTLEICVDRIDSVRAASDAGAQRIELCSALSDGGLTPTVGFLEIVKREFPALKVFAMLRPRGGNDFVYTRLEMDCILSDLTHLRAAGADGFVFGALNADRSIDEPSCRRVITAAAPLPVTFHRAFDLTDPAELQENTHLVDRIGFKRLLTSGLAPSALAGLENIQKIQSTECKLIVMPGAGINVENAERILAESGCTEFHSSGRCGAIPATDVGANGIDFGHNEPSDRRTIGLLLDIAKKMDDNN